jgi:hypothetical protein
MSIAPSCCLGVKLGARETPNPQRLTEPLSFLRELRDLIGPAFPIDWISFDEGDAARAGISNLTGVTVLTRSTRRS